MSHIETKTIDSQSVWEQFLKSHPEANFLQSWYWGEFHRTLNKTINRTGFFQHNKLVGIVLSVVEDAKRGRYLTIPGGPIIDWRNNQIVSEFTRYIKQMASKHTCVFVRVRPQLVEDELSRNLFARLGFRPAPMHLHAEQTSQLDITKSEEELLMNMRKTTRYEIKKATSLGIQITSSTDPNLMNSFYQLQLETAKRQGFVPFSEQFLVEQFKVFVNAGLALLYTASYQDQQLAQAFIIFYGKEAVYHYGASTDAGRKYPGAYLIQWEAIKEAKKRTMERYNFWGVAPVNDPTHRFYGVSVFKRGFGGMDVSYLHAQDLVVNEVGYKLNEAIERTRKIFRRV